MQRKKDRPLTLEILRNGGEVERLDNSPRPQVSRGRRRRYDHVPQPEPIDYRNDDSEP